MNAQQKGIITLIKSAIDGQAYPLPEAFDIDQAVKEALKHKIIALIYYGAINCGIDRKCDAMTKLFQYTARTLAIVKKQQMEIDRVIKAFEANGIEYLPMKGVVLQKSYYKAEMRSMGDVDVLIRMEQYETIQQIMMSLGFAFQYESDHELVWSHNHIMIELHKRVMTSYNADFYKYFGDGWKFAKKISADKTGYRLSDEDFYVYMFVHFTKHYRVSGIGIKHLVDLWVFLRDKPDMDKDYIRGELVKINLLDFHENVMDTIRLWFADGELTEKTDYISQVIFSSGEYGSENNSELSRILRESVKLGSRKAAKWHDFWNRVCPPYAEMCKAYCVVRKVPVLLPVFWGIRWGEIFLLKRKRLHRFFDNNIYSEKRINNRKKALELVGLDFYAEDQIQG